MIEHAIQQTPSGTTDAWSVTRVTREYVIVTLSTFVPYGMIWPASWAWLDASR